ncbi:T9SS type A sorting domain-containing protein [Hymenobacter psychrotolerans]|uniref:Por secretion system C-terminal sorting domain-containing protein n=1 Tax=Hymenobacter psychrotolerans DSM 18569 TaxID=1121959 RepID=A0A1M6RZ94_9BACT|nr:T9SS type A sorting domain-containing protein [Hymenobacter psychrotolerans]SHK37783.1 Por secretion system C-terminal sorting domain-containing protein [Hymenobacter psychrotolerans DSM 18569]
MKISTRIFGVLAILLAQLSALAATVTVEVGDGFYRPAAITIRPGDEVRWVNVGTQTHATVSDNGAWSTFAIGPAAFTASIPFSKAGTFSYHCPANASFSGEKWTGMTGVITVSNAPQATLDAKAANVSLTLYPNPSKGMVTVTLGSKAAPGDYKLRLNNIIGREVRTIALRPEAVSAGVPINLSDLPAGMYLYSLLHNDKVVATKRLVLQN